MKRITCKEESTDEWPKSKLTIDYYKKEFAQRENYYKMSQ